MKKIGILLVSAALLLALCACGTQGEPEDEKQDAVVQQTPEDEPEQAPEDEPEQTPEGEPEQVPGEQTPQDQPEQAPDEQAQTPEDEPEQTPDEQAQTLSAEDAKAAAEGCIGSSVETLYQAIGYPTSSDYAPSCLGDGEDGNLYYSGFVVYTFRSGGSETVSYVE